MPIRGDRFEIFHPLYDMDDEKKTSELLSDPTAFISSFEERTSWATSMTQGASHEMDPHDRAILMYLEMMKGLLSGTAFGRAELTVYPQAGQVKLKTHPLNIENRKNGLDFTFLGDTMTGWARLDNVYDLLRNVTRNNIKGDYIETGVWRGGSSIFAKAALRALEPNSGRVSYVCDSFHGLPPGDKSLNVKDKGWNDWPYLSVSSDIVANNFIKYGLLDATVVFAKGFFNETMPLLRNQIEFLSIMRLDGDMYESTVDVLYNLYDKLSIGGYAIIDDWYGFPAKTACLDFFEVHGINPTIVTIDIVSVYWQKTEQIDDIQYWRYEQSKFKLDDKRTN
eukprot:CAMPEP_0172370636 /NCGR_PEP_ID=MMETSP1060-20121228/38711_1 /TAXON_ID=37318 /ORGANISM="Pseudo-nitzschia pungens, Strain cf. cingulata" /LENGTH=336 /DNA_ID=CAMNT_0013095965 /DNA_START=268 /DNA_END=1281 /DNA_ORIENTATION=+